MVCGQPWKLTQGKLLVFALRCVCFRLRLGLFRSFCYGPHAHETLVGVSTGLTRTRDFETNVPEVYVCMYVSIYLSIYLCIYVSMYLCIYVSMYLCMYLPYTYTHTHIHIHIHILFIYMYTLHNLYTYIYIYNYIHIYIYIYIYIYILYTYIYVYMYIYIYILYICHLQVHRQGFFFSLKHMLLLRQHLVLSDSKWHARPNPPTSPKDFKLRAGWLKYVQMMSDVSKNC